MFGRWSFGARTGGHVPRPGDHFCQSLAYLSANRYNRRLLAWLCTPINLLKLADMFNVASSLSYMIVRIPPTTVTLRVKSSHAWTTRAWFDRLTHFTSWRHHYCQVDASWYSLQRVCSSLSNPRGRIHSITIANSTTSLTFAHSHAYRSRKWPRIEIIRLYRLLLAGR